MKVLPATQRMDAADFSRAYRQMLVGPDVTLQDLLRPGFWVHHAEKIGVFDIVDVLSTDGALDVQLRVTGRERGLLYVRPLRVYAEDGRELAPPEEVVNEGDVPEGYVVDFTEKTSWRARTRNPAILVQDGLKSRAEAIAAAVNHATKANGSAPVMREDVEIPANWQDMTWPEKRSLASKLTDDPVRNGADADAAIELEIERRKAA